MSSQQLSNLLLSVTGLARVIAAVFSMTFFFSIIKADLVNAETVTQPRSEIADNSKTCGDRNRGNGTFDCPI